MHRPRSIEEIVVEQIHRSDLTRRTKTENGITCPGLVIAISRRMGSGARIVAGKLSKALGWPVWDKELLDAIATDAHISRKVVEAFDERALSEIEVLVRAMLGDHEMDGFIYPRHLAKAVASVARYGNAIILGRGANFLLPNALSIRIDSSDEVRVQNMMTYENLSREQAVDRLKRSDRERQDFLDKTFGKDRVRCAHYDLSIWMDGFTSDEAVEIIKPAIEARCRGLEGKP